MARDPTSLVSAALRHVRDAELLLDPTHGRPSPDQAFHLGGYGPECARKATLSVNWFDKVMGHRMDAGIEDLLATAVALDPTSSRYDTRSWSARHPALAGWSEQSRYDRTGTRSKIEANRLVEEAREIVDGLTLALWMDGRLPGGLS